MQLLYGEKAWTDASERGFFTKVSVGQTAYFKGGNDTVDGANAADRFFGGAGDDEINGAGGNDLIVDTRGNNDISGGDNNDTIIGGGGTLNAQGNAGSDRLIGGIGNDTLDGGSGNDSLRGDPAGSFISGDDILIGGSGNDWMEGGGGADTFVFRLSDGSGANRIGQLDLSGATRAIVGQDFEVGIDVIDLQGFGLSATQIQNSLSFVSGDTIFAYDQGGVNMTITIEGATLSASDFI